MKGLPNLHTFGPHLFERFAVRSLPEARVLWLNHRWFLDYGLDISSPEIRDSVIKRLLRNFAVCAFGAGDNDAETAFLLADRYGGTEGNRHGGSGRAGIKGHFNAKGIGRTPLASEDVDWAHRHGFLWLHEAIREAISSEICAAELPFSSIPILAIIDAGEARCSENSEERDRCAIVVRPNFLRPAHFERSILFGSGGSRVSPQYVDALRVKQVIQTAAISGQDFFADLRTMFLRIATQIGAARAHRLWQGQFVTSNLSVDGALVDFGAFRSVQNWERATGEPGQAFGQDKAAIALAIQSQCFYFSKFAPQKSSDPSVLFADVSKRLETAFVDSALEVLPDLPRQARIGIAELFRHYYSQQQRNEFRLGRNDRSVWRRPWLYPAFVDPGAQVGEAERQCAAALRTCLANALSPGASTASATHALGRWLTPRPLLYYELAEPRSRLLVKTLRGDASDTLRVHAYIDHVLGKSRRVWPSFPAHLELVGQSVTPASSALYSFDRARDQYSAWIQGRVVGPAVYTFGQRVPLSSLEGTSLRIDGRKANFVVPLRALPAREAMPLSLGGVDFVLPKPAFVYPQTIL